MMDFIFKGSRKYIHVTDIYNNLVLGKNYDKLSITFKKKLLHQPKIIFKNSLHVKLSKKPNCIINISRKNINKKILLFDTKKKVKTSYYYNESLLYEYFKLKKKLAECNFRTSISSIEVLVSLTKYFHIKKIKNYDWFFARLRLVNRLQEKNNKNFSIFLKKNYLNEFTISDIYQNNKYIGEIEFSKNNS